MAVTATPTFPPGITSNQKPVPCTATVGTMNTFPRTKNNTIRGMKVAQFRLQSFQC